MAFMKKPYSGLTGGWLTFWITIACATEMMLFGYDQGVFSGVIVTPDFLQVHNLVGPSRTKVLSTVSAIYDFASDILGLGNGINTATAPIWQTETAQSKWRGRLVILDLGLNVGGYCVVNWINYGLSFHEGAIAWRLPIALQLFFVVFLLVTVPWLPGSPRCDEIFFLLSTEHESDCD
ncbi:Major facilitator superfamily domain general substrate transporter [Penicillium angulare]|uniref:Major facilitator superfamily domain general substrate transporter n=1 Tax=Penicillium angulare TaxID=116970 RepID=UPI0025419C8B|nr:Major facilitator superfamily domain general substrate transporter [Penicillium angulare]KAJ5291199.1 Major facilitator superfamily domain general substrate transporter [Penicillium angulare]